MTPDRTKPQVEALPPLETGDQLDQKTFHERYEAMPEGTRAELVGGVVYVHSPAKKAHSLTHSRVNRWLGDYSDETPGTEAYIDMTTLIAPECEPQPDNCLLIEPEVGGQTTEVDGWTVGVPEMIVEVANSTEAIDLHGKKEDYRKGGVKEYVVVALRQRRLRWFVNVDEKLVERQPSPDGLFRSEAFPGLWLDPEALLRGDMRRVRAVLAQGLATPEHAAFAALLASRRQDAP